MNNFAENAKAGLVCDHEPAHAFDKKITPSAYSASLNGSQAAFRRTMRKVHALGPRVLGELLLEIMSEAADAQSIMRRMERYANLSGDFIAANGGDDFIIHHFVIEGGR
jgi:hypothetical protein